MQILNMTMTLGQAAGGNSIWLPTLLSPPVLFFVLGLIAVAIRSDLALPDSVKKALSLYLLFSIGFKGGAMLRESGLTSEGMAAMGIAAVLSAATPLWLFPILRKRLGSATAGGVAATYGSVSAVTFMAAVTMLRDRGVDFGGHMVAAMVIMEFPALIIGVLLARALADNETGKAPDAPRTSLATAMRASATNGPIVLLVGSMLIGALTTDDGRQLTAPMWSELFTGVLCFYLLDLGLIAGKGVRSVLAAGWLPVLVGVLFPPINAMIALGLSRSSGLTIGDTFLMMAMAASASYIAAPAALRIALPEAKASVYVPMALTLTFPVNITIGLPVYWVLAQRFAMGG